MQAATAQALADLRALQSYGGLKLGSELLAACYQQWQALVACQPVEGDVHGALQEVGV